MIYCNNLSHQIFLKVVLCLGGYHGQIVRLYKLQSHDIMMIIFILRIKGKRKAKKLRQKQLTAELSFRLSVGETTAEIVS